MERLRQHSALRRSDTIHDDDQLMATLDGKYEKCTAQQFDEKFTNERQIFNVRRGDAIKLKYRTTIVRDLH